MARRRGVSSRRAEIDRRARRRVFVRRAATLLCVGVMLGGGVWYTMRLLAPGRIPISKIHITGIDEQRRTEIAPVFKAYWQQNYLTLDLNHLRQELLSNPWLSNVSIRRNWPSELRISATQREVFGYWGHDQLVAVDGHSFRPMNLPQRSDWPHLVGPDGQEKVVMAAYVRARETLAPVGLEVLTLQQNSRLEWQLVVTGGVRIIIGQDGLGDGEFIEQLQRFADVYPRALRSRFAEIEAVDMRYINGFSVRWNSGGIQANTGHAMASALA